MTTNPPAIGVEPGGSGGEEVEGRGSNESDDDSDVENVGMTNSEKRKEMSTVSLTAKIM